MHELWVMAFGNCSGNVNWKEECPPGPNEVGFGYCLILAANPDRGQQCYADGT